MSWDSTIENQMVTDVNNAKSQTNTSLDLIVNQTERAALKFDGAQDQINIAKETVDEKINAINVITDKLSNIIETLYSKAADVKDKIKETKEKGEIVRFGRDEAKTFADIRTEQVKELKNKYEGNYHSSWLGLWRPLASESRTGLFIASIVLGVIATLSIVFIMIDPITKLLPASLPAQFRPHIGGFMKQFLKNK